MTSAHCRYVLITIAIDGNSRPYFSTYVRQIVWPATYVVPLSILSMATGIQTKIFSQKFDAI